MDKFVMFLKQKETKKTMSIKGPSTSFSSIGKRINQFIKNMFDDILIDKNKSKLEEYFTADIRLHGVFEGQEIDGFCEFLSMFLEYQRSDKYTFNSNTFENIITEFSPSLYGAVFKSNSLFIKDERRDYKIRIASIIIVDCDTFKFKDLTLTFLSKRPKKSNAISIYSRLKAVFEASPAPIFLKDLDGHYLSVNKKFLDFYHLESEQHLIGFTSESIMDEKSSKHCRLSDLKVIRENSSFSGIEVIPNEDGTKSYLQISKTPFYENGVMIGIIGYIYDVTLLQTISSHYEATESEVEYIFNQSEVAYFVKNNDRRYTRINKTFEDTFNVTKEEVLGKTSDEVDWKNNTDNIKEIKAMMDINSNQECTHYVLDKNKNLKYLALIETPLKIKGKKTGTFGICRDISLSIAKKIELNKKYNDSIRYRKETIAFIVVDLEDMKITECYTRNDELSLTGKFYSEDVFNLFSDTITYERDRKEFYYHFFPKNLVNNFSLTDKYNIKCDMVTFIKTSMTANISIDYSYNSVTNHKEAYVFATDIFKERQMREIVERVNSSEYDFIVRINFQINTVEYIISNQSPITERVGTLSSIQSFLDCIYESNDTIPLIAADFVNCLKSHLMDRDDYRYTIDFANGKRKSTIVKSVDRENSVILMLLQDITSITEKDIAIKNKLENAVLTAVEANKSKSDFLARMSHDMRTPLNGIIGLSDFGFKESTEPLIRDYFSKISSSSNFLLLLINDVLDMQSIEKGKLKLYSIPLITKDCFEGIGIIVSPRANEKNINLKITKDGEGPKYIMGDCLRMQQIFSNILGNSIKYTPSGGTINWVISYLERGNTTIARHVISDNGIGMSEAFQEHMFDSFSTEPNRYSQSERSSGLGLAIVKTMIELMDGSIRCYSELNKGTSFEIDIPLQVISKREFDAVQAPDLLNVVNLEKKRVLLCEDNNINIIITKKILSQRGIIVDVAENGSIGVENVKSGNYDAVLMDIRMPIMDGLTAAKKIREFDKLIPIIAVSANAYEEDRKKSLSSGMNAHISKPINQMELFNALQRLL